MDTLNDLKKLFEQQDTKKENPELEKEKRFLREAASKLSGTKNLSSIQGYDPKEMLIFLGRPIKELQETLGGEWKEMTEDEFSTFVYMMTKKVNKSSMVINWDKK